MNYSTIETRSVEKTTWITLNRPKAMNALNGQMIDELTDVLRAVETDSEAHSVVLTGRGKAFCAGADLTDVLDGLVPRTDGSKDFLDKAAQMYLLLRNMPKPVIGALNGITMAGGLELALACDVLFASQSASIADAHSNFGVFPGAGGAAVLPRRIGLNNAKYLLFSGKSLPASQFLSCGFISEVVPDAELEARVAEFSKELARKSPLGLSRMKAVANASMDKTMDDALRYELATLRQHLRSRDMHEGLAAFREKRTPAFVGE